MKLREYLDGVNIFELIKDVEAFEFLTVSSIPQLNSLLMLFHGDKTTFEAFELITPENAANIFVTKSKDYWDSLLKYEEIKDAVGNTRTIEETIGDIETTSNLNERLSKTSAYNSSAMVNDTGDTTNSSGDRESDRTRTLTETNIDVKSAYELLTHEGKTSLNSKIVKDVAEFFTLSIY